MEKFLIRAIKVGLYGILLTPVFFARSFIYPFLTPKVFVFQALVELIFGLWLGLIIFYPAYRPKFTKLTWGVLIFLLVFAISAVFGVDPQRSVWSTQDRALGLVSLFHFGILFLILANLKDKLNWRRFFIFGFFVSVVVAVFAIVEIYFPRFFLEYSSGRPGSFLGNPAFLASYLIFHIFIGFWLAAETYKNRGGFGNLLSWSLVGGTLLEIFIVFITGTRGALLGLALGVLVFLFYLAFTRRGEAYFGFSPRGLRITSAIFLSLILLFGAGFWFSRDSSWWQKIPVVGRFTNLSFNSPDAQTRLIAWQIAWASFKERPFLGFGFENFKYPFDKHYEPKLLRYGFGETYFDKPHNVFFEYLAVGGVLGLLAYLFLILVWLRGLLSFTKLKRFAPFGLGLVAAYLGQNFFVFDTFGSYLPLFIVLAFVDACDVKREIVGKASKILVWPETGKKLLVGGLVLAAAVPVYFWNVKTLYANNRQYWGLNYFFNRMPSEGLEAYAKALNTRNPYQDAARRDFASTLKQAFELGMEIPGVEQVSGQVMAGLAEAINNHPNDFFLRYTFADLGATFYVFNPKYLEMADDQIIQSLKLSPRRQSIYHIGAKLKIIEGKKEEAIKMMKEAVDLDPEVGDPHFFYGLIALQAKQYDLGFSEIKRAEHLGRKATSPDEMRVLANFYGDFGKYNEAISLYQEALKRDSRDVESRLKLGLVYYMKGDKDLAGPLLLQVSKMVDITKSPYFGELRPIYNDLGIRI